MTDEQSWRSAVERVLSEHAHLGVLVNNAGMGERVNSIHPGFIRTPILDQAQGTEIWDAMTASAPLGRFGEPEEMAAAVAYLASDDASFVTGSELSIDGGQIAR